MVGPAQQSAAASTLARMQQCVHSLLSSIQEDPSRQGLLDTPKVSQCCVGIVVAPLMGVPLPDHPPFCALVCLQRVAKAMLDMTEGYRADPTL